MSVDIVSVVVRAASFMALFQAAGVALFMVLFGHLLSSSEQSIRRIGVISAWAGIVLVALHQLLAAARMTGEFTGLSDASMHMLALRANAGVANSLRIMGLLLIALTLLHKHRSWLVASAAGATLVAMSFLVTGHTSSNPQRWFMAPLLMVHLWVAAFWFGSLWPLYVVSTRESRNSAAELIALFSTMAGWLVPGIAIAGVLMAWVLLPDANALWAPYGWLLLVKATGFALLMGLAALNKWRLGPAMAAGDERAAQSFRRSVMIELLLICVVLSATAVMTGLFSPEP